MRPRVPSLPSRRAQDAPARPAMAPCSAYRGVGVATLRPRPAAGLQARYQARCPRWRPQQRARQRTRYRARPRMRGHGAHAHTVVGVAPSLSQTILYFTLHAVRYAWTWTLATSMPLGHLLLYR